MSTETMTHEQAYAKALLYYTPEHVESAFCASDDWRDAFEILGIYEDED